jgi:O-antigen/teichoic acid export membrane protein
MTGRSRVSAAWSGAKSGHLVLAGVIDAGVSSLATFVIGLYATRALEPEALGGYALAFSVFVLSGFIPAQVIFTPTEIAAVDYPRKEQLPLLRASLLRGSVVSLAAAAATSTWFVLAPADLPPGTVQALVITCAAATFVSPLQDHLRRMLHINRHSWRSVLVAVVQIAVAIGGVAALTVGGVEPAWIPFGALAAANVASFTLGLLLSAREIVAATPAVPLPLQRLLRSARSLLTAGLAPSIATFVVSWQISVLAGAATLGFVEAARIVGQPVAVLQLGLLNVLGPRATRAASSRDRTASRRVNRLFRRLILLAGGGWLLAVGVPFAWNPMATLLPTAYVVPWLVAASIAAFTVLSLSQGYRFELYGARRERQVAQAEIEGNAGRIAIAFAAGALGPFVAPLGIAALGVVRQVRSVRGLREHYGPTDAAGRGGPDDEPTDAAGRGGPEDG